VAWLEPARSSAARKSEARADGGAIDRRALNGRGTVCVLAHAEGTIA